MESNIVVAVAIAGGVGVADFSVWGLFQRSDLVIKATMIILFVASFWSWTIIIDKWLKLRRLASDAEKFEENFWSGGSLDELYERLGTRPGDPMAAVFAAAMSEWINSASIPPSNRIWIRSWSALVTSCHTRLWQVLITDSTRPGIRLIIQSR